ncbi:MAG: CDP-glycerol glycerophosphotransferase family protein [Eubacterium sp.]|nr:CDP-glycerol glycerophosphotransferase family protein [Eubacterium sp.]
MKRNSIIAKAKRYAKGKIISLSERTISAERKKNNSDFAKLEVYIKGKDQDHIWAFCAGNTSQDFRGNPKFLFAYIQYYRPDIFAYWFCEEEETLEQVRGLGFPAFDSNSAEAHYLFSLTGVLVAEQVKDFIPAELKCAKYLNLWHGVGFKRVERKLYEGTIAMPIAKKYVRNNAYYRDYQLLCVTSPMIEKEFALDCGVDDDHFIRCGYVRNLYQRNFRRIASFDHDLRKRKGLSPKTRFAVYAPTYRAKHGDAFASAMKDLEALYACCEKNDILMIFKVHPYMEKEAAFLDAKKRYGDRQYFMFWDNREDFYEVMDQMDLAIIDYSSIVSDMIEMGIPHYIRYVFDIDEYCVEGVTQSKEAFYERTLGEICLDFRSLLRAIESFENKQEEEDIKRIHDLFWSYSKGKDDFETIIEKAVSFKVTERQFPVLYSFDVFDTLISRKVLEPEGIFYAVRERMIESGEFPSDLVNHYPSIRQTCEQNVREYYRKTQDERASDHIEIQMWEIFERMKTLYELQDDQAEKLMDWEIQEELDNVIPLTEQIQYVKELRDNGNTVVLISDMYLSEEIVRKMLVKADPALSDVPLFLSSSFGVQKTTQKLFFEVYKSFSPYYNFGKWIHTGDNEVADRKRPRDFRIEAHQIKRPEFGNLQTQMVKEIGTKDAFLVAALQARMGLQYTSPKEQLVLSFISLCMVPYIDWVLNDAVRRGYQILYFVSRDGHHLKRIADVIIAKRNLPLETKYIYASRRTWRIPSFITEIDPSFWLSYGNFNAVQSAEKLLKAMDIDQSTFDELFSEVDLEQINFEDKEESQALVDVVKSSSEYESFLLRKAEEERILVCGYLKQEIDEDKPFAMVEYWGRGNAQACFTRLWEHTIGKEADAPFYYLRSILPTEGHSIRHNFVSNNVPLLFMESIFANMPYKSVEKYVRTPDGIQPKLEAISYDQVLFEATQVILPQFAAEYAQLELQDRDATARLLQEFALNYFDENKGQEEFADQIGVLTDSAALFSNKREFAPPFTMEMLDKFEEKELARGETIVTSSISMSVARSSKAVKERYFEMYQIFPGEDPAGGILLKEKHRKLNETYEKRYINLIQQAKDFKGFYDEAVQNNDVKKQILFVGDKSAFGSTQNLGMLLGNSAFENTVKAQLVRLELDTAEKNLKEAAQLFAQSAVVISQNPIPFLYGIKLREETKQILIPGYAVSFYKKGLGMNYYAKWQDKYQKTASRNAIDYIQLPAETLKDEYLSAFAPALENVKTIPGCCFTDLYYDRKFAENARKKLITVMPEAASKKIILYLPHVRLVQEDYPWASLLEMHALQHLLGNEYMVAVHMNKRQMEQTPFDNVLEVEGFSRLIKRGISLRELMVACDVIVGDYRDTFFEAALMDKPVLASAGDYDNMRRDSNISGITDDWTSYEFCPIVRTAGELAECLNNPEGYNNGKIKAFRDKYLTACDGNSVGRFAEKLCEILDYS